MFNITNKKIKKALAVTLSLATVLSSMSFFAVNIDKFDLSIFAATEEQKAEYWDYCNTEGVYQYVDFSPFWNPTSRVYSVRNAEQLAALSVLVNANVQDGTTLQAANGSNAKKSNFEGKKIDLYNKINLSGHKWVPIGKDDASVFKGDIKGNYNNKKWSVIEGANITSDPDGEVYKYAGIFGHTTGDFEDITASNINIDVDGSNYTGGIIAYCEGDISYSRVIDSDIKTINSNYVGGITGYCKGMLDSLGCFVDSSKRFVDGSGHYIDQTGKQSGYITDKLGHVATTPGLENTTIHAIDPLYVGGISGFCNEESLVLNCDNDEESKIIAEFTNHREGFIGVGGIVGGIVSRDSGGGISNCTNRSGIEIRNNIENLQLCVGGLIGYASGVDKSLCTNETNMTNISAAHVGGIVGYDEDSRGTSFCLNCGVCVSE